ncbi:hypothetical protein ACLOAU_16220 [Niabella sp. CJ426]|uniref:hypothetical protein n=1 Tax=Niabella sp. CJ426 TaxID=3393740 RepID=UPI003D035EE2
MSHFISLQEAAAMTARYRSHREGVLLPQHQNQNLLALNETFDLEAVDALLAQPGCKGLRIYYGMDESLKMHAILVATDANNADIIHVSKSDDGEQEGIILENANRCPPLCPPASELNEP